MCVAAVAAGSSPLLNFFSFLHITMHGMSPKLHLLIWLLPYFSDIGLRSYPYLPVTTPSGQGTMRNMGSGSIWVCVIKLQRRARRETEVDIRISSSRRGEPVATMREGRASSSRRCQNDRPKHQTLHDAVMFLGASLISESTKDRL